MLILQLVLLFLLIGALNETLAVDDIDFKSIYNVLLKNDTKAIRQVKVVKLMDSYKMMIDRCFDNDAKTGNLARCEILNEDQMLCYGLGEYESMDACISSMNWFIEFNMRGGSMKCTNVEGKRHISGSWIVTCILHYKEKDTVDE